MFRFNIRVFKAWWIFNVRKLVLKWIGYLKVVKLQFKKNNKKQWLIYFFCYVYVWRIKKITFCNEHDIHRNSFLLNICVKDQKNKISISSCTKIIISKKHIKCWQISTWILLYLYIHRHNILYSSPLLYAKLPCQFKQIPYPVTDCICKFLYICTKI